MVHQHAMRGVALQPGCLQRPLAALQCGCTAVWLPAGASALGATALGGPLTAGTQRRLCWPSWVLLLLLLLLGRVGVRPPTLGTSRLLQGGGGVCHAAWLAAWQTGCVAARGRAFQRGQVKAAV